MVLKNIRTFAEIDLPLWRQFHTQNNKHMGRMKVEDEALRNQLLNNLPVKFPLIDAVVNKNRQCFHQMKSRFKNYRHGWFEKIGDEWPLPETPEEIRKYRKLHPAKRTKRTT